MQAAVPRTVLLLRLPQLVGVQVANALVGPLVPDEEGAIAVAKLLFEIMGHLGDQLGGPPLTQVHADRLACVVLEASQGHRVRRGYQDGAVDGENLGVTRLRDALFEGHSDAGGIGVASHRGRLV